MKTIMVVEDEQDLCENIMSLLEAKGYSVITAGNGLEALKQLRDTIPDLIISDIMMPFIDGYELFRRVKENPKVRMLPFLFLSAKSDLISIRKGMGIGADDYITKPFRSEDLLNTIKIRLEKSEAVKKHIDEIKDNINKYIPHELRTPLVAILGYSQIIMSEYKTLDKDEIYDFAERINIGANRLHNRIEKFIQLSDLEYIMQDDSKIVFTEVNEELIKINTFEHLCTKKERSRVKFNIKPASVKVPGHYLKIIINELVENAIKFSDQSKPVEINGFIKDNFYIIEVKDLGIGMSSEEISNIDAFQQFNRELFQQEGNGLGLIFVFKAINNIGGKIKINSVKDEFTTVTVKIPVYKD